MEFLVDSLRHTKNLAEGYKTGTLFYEDGYAFISVKKDKSEFVDYELCDKDDIQEYVGGQYVPISFNDLFHKKEVLAGVEIRVKFGV
ncbi:hypothetical protein POF51_26110 [Brevibacillus sp. AG]|uniref:hypothetical protein n=1 Tax=Brevibacillus sp. AG TaxID=3020891 RepID=UPI00232CE0C6|nr:hypothetical protein [Brevibacillus sp. AG]MDC0764198.1 hypothetical protein [Brevibacillus sp. AG]